MRRPIGILLLIAGTGGLAYWATNDHAPHIEEVVTAQATDLALAADRPLEVRVSGRDVTVEGSVETEADLTALTDRFGGIEGLRVLNLSQVAVLPTASPFVLNVVKDESGALVAEGVLPSDALRADLAARDGQAFADLPLAYGAPDAAWGAALDTGLDALADLPSGAVSLTDQTVTLTGTVPLPEDKDRIVAMMQDLPEGYDFRDEVDVLDDGRPLQLDVLRSAEVTRATGKLPAGMDLSEVTTRFPMAQADLVQARIPAQQGDWPATAGTALDALGALSEGRLTIEGTSITLTGQGTPDGIAEANALLDTVPEGYSVTRSLDLSDDGAPLQLTVDYTGSAATAFGKYPAGFTPSGPAGLPVSDTGEESFLTSDSFAANAEAGVAALGQLQSGQLVVTEDSITLTGTATSLQVGTVIDGLLDGVPATITRDLTYIDDGSPAAWTLTYGADSGGAIEGRLPATLTTEDLSNALGLSLSGTPATAVEDDSAGSAAEVLSIAAEVLPELETLSLAADGTGLALDVVTAPGVDIDLLAADLAERLPADVAFSIQPTIDLPQQGTARTNVSTGLREVFLNGFWIPDFDFTTTVEGCGDQSKEILANGRINFLSGSARLDATSIRTINALAAVALPCVEADLDLEVAGHTDASGDAAQNQILSQERAEAVRLALINRGVPASAMTAIGFGADRPVATNDTPEGRTLNRRTEIDWFEKGAQRDP